MKTRLFSFLPAVVPVSVALLLAIPCVGGTRPRPVHRAAAVISPALRERLVQYLWAQEGWQGMDTIRVQSIGPARDGLRQVDVYVAKGKQHAIQKFYITANGRKIISGDVTELTANPFGANVGKLAAGPQQPAEGPSHAAVTIYEFSDLECPYCKQEFGQIQKLRGELGSKVKVIFRPFPLVNIHPWAREAAKVATCVAQQSPQAFWTFAGSVFQAQDQIKPEEAARRLHDFALESGINQAPLDRCLADPATAAQVQTDIGVAQSLGVNSTPTIFVNGRMIPGVIDYNVLKTLVEYASTHSSAAPPLPARALKGKQCGACGTLPPLPRKKH